MPSSTNRPRGRSRRVKAMLAVRARAKKLRRRHRSRKCTSGADGTGGDGRREAGRGGRWFVSAGRGRAGAGANCHRIPHCRRTSPQPLSPHERSHVRLAKRLPMRTQPMPVASGQPEQPEGRAPQHGPVMADAHAKVVPTTLVDDADLHARIGGSRTSPARLIRRDRHRVLQDGVPARNAWFEGRRQALTGHPPPAGGHRHRGGTPTTACSAVALRNADMLDANGIREGDQPPARAGRGSFAGQRAVGLHHLAVSNFGMFAGRYATPVVVPPCGDRRRRQASVTTWSRWRHRSAPAHADLADLRPSRCTGRRGGPCRAARRPRPAELTMLAQLTILRVPDVPPALARYREVPSFRSDEAGHAAARRHRVDAVAFNAQATPRPRSPARCTCAATMSTAGGRGCKGPARVCRSGICRNMR